MKTKLLLSLAIALSSSIFAAVAIPPGDINPLPTQTVVGRSAGGTGAASALTTLPNSVQDNITRLGAVTSATTITASAGQNLVLSPGSGGGGVAIASGQRLLLGLNENSISTTGGGSTMSLMQNGTAKATLSTNGLAVVTTVEAAADASASITTAGGIYAAKKIYPAGGILGTAAADAAAAGTVGELLSAQLAAASTTALVTATGKTITSVSLTAGDWEVSGTVHFIPANTTVVASLIASVSAADNTQASVDLVGGYASIGAVYTSGGATMSATPIPTRISLAATTTYYLVATGTFSVSTCTAYGTIRARRLR